MRIYIAAHSQELALELKRALEAAGHSVVSRWIVEDKKFADRTHKYSDNERRALAIMDESDTREADVLVLISESEGKMVPGGKHVETGIALALRKPVYVLGRRENVFHWHPLVTVVPSIPDLLQLLEPGRSVPAGP